MTVRLKDEDRLLTDADLSVWFGVSRMTIARLALPCIRLGKRKCRRYRRQAGVDEGTIMALCGWKTRAMFDRYAIINDVDLADAVARRYGKQAANKEGTAAAVPPLSSTAAMQDK